MLQAPKIVACFPAKLKDLRIAGVQHPVTIEHSLIKCSVCAEDAWIGPKQRMIHTFQGYPAVC